MTAIRVQEGRLSVLGTYQAVLGTGYKVLLFTAPGSVSVTTGISALTEATFPGYARQAPTFATATIDANGNAESVGSTVTFTRSAGAGSQTVVGWALIDEVNNKLTDVELFGAGIVIATAGDFISVTPKTYQGACVTPL